MTPQHGTPRPHETDGDGIRQQTLLLGGAVAAVLVGALTVSAWWFTNVGLLLATTACIAVLALVAQRLVQAHRPMAWQTAARAATDRRGADTRVGLLRHTVERAARGDAEATAEVHALLAELARGRGPLGPDLDTFLDHPSPGRLDTAALRRHLTTLEELS
jgi:hypothetical protein